jgi:ADP-ribose pyrophosphatase YjhB (NUDIX family)
MSIAINNAGSPLEYHSIPKRINAAIVNIPLDRLKELYPDIQRFTAMAVKFSYHPDSLSKLRVLLIKRHGKESSWGNTWETGGGALDEEDRTIIHSAARESKEETQIWPLSIAGNAFTCSFYHKDRETGDIVLMRTLGFIVIDNEVTIKNGETIKNEETMAQRVWSSEMQQPVGQSSVEISDEHLDHCWFTEDEVRSAALYVKGTPPGPFAMLLAKKDMVLLAFELFRQSQGQNVPPLVDIVR